MTSTVGPAAHPAVVRHEGRRPGRLRGRDVDGVAKIPLRASAPGGVDRDLGVERRQAEVVDRADLVGIALDERPVTEARGPREDLRQADRREDALAAAGVDGVEEQAGGVRLGAAALEQVDEDVAVDPRPGGGARRGRRSSSRDSVVPVAARARGRTRRGRCPSRSARRVHAAARTAAPGRFVRTIESSVTRPRRDGRHARDPGAVARASRAARRSGCLVLSA